MAHHLEVTPQAIRRHLKNLEASELIEHQRSQEGIGRPNHMYQLSRKGREHFPAQYDQFALSLLNTVADTLGPEQVSKLLKHQWQLKAKEYRRKTGRGTAKGSDAGAREAAAGRRLYGRVLSSQRFGGTACVCDY